MENLFEVLLNADQLIGDIVNRYGMFTYLIVFMIIFMETGFVVANFFPGDSLLFATGILASTGDLKLIPLIILLFLATILGNTSNYLIGRYIGGHFIKKQNAKMLRHFRKAAAYYERHGMKAVIVSRFIPFMRTFIPFFSGTSRMNFSAFTVANLLGGLMWILLYVLLGYYFGEIPFVREHLGMVFLAMILLVFFGLLLLVGKSFWNKTNRIKTLP